MRSELRDLVPTHKFGSMLMVDRFNVLSMSYAVRVRIKLDVSSVVWCSEFDANGGR